MALNEDNISPCCIHSYTDGRLTLRDDRVFTTSVIINNKQDIASWGPRSLETLTDDDFTPLIEQKPDVVLLGTGSHFHLLSAKILRPLHSQGIGVECMDTATACRSFVALSAESRHVIAALILE